MRLRSKARRTEPVQPDKWWDRRQPLAPRTAPEAWSKARRATRRDRDLTGKQQANRPRSVPALGPVDWRYGR